MTALMTILFKCKAINLQNNNVKILRLAEGLVVILQLKSIDALGDKFSYFW